MVYEAPGGSVLEAPDGPQEGLRRFQEACRKLEEDPRRHPGSFQEAPGGSNRRLPGGSQEAPGGSQEVSRSFMFRVSVVFRVDKIKVASIA